MKTPFIVLLVAHGSFHLLGFAKSFGLAELQELHGPMSRPLGTLWLLAALSFFASAALFALASRDWSIVALPAIVLSQILILTCWSDAKFGTIANLIVLVPVVLSLVAAQNGHRGSGERTARAVTQIVRV